MYTFCLACAEILKSLVKLNKRDQELFPEFHAQCFMVAVSTTVPLYIDVSLLGKLQNLQYFHFAD